MYSSSTSRIFFPLSTIPATRWIDLGLAGRGLRGKRSGLPLAAARHAPRSGHASQRGTRGVQTSAPSSMRAWLCSPEFRAGTSGRASARTFASVAGTLGSSRRPWSRHRTRTTFPSTTGSGTPKEIDATAAAVYAPTPGRSRQPSSVRGNVPHAAIARAAR